MYPDQLSIAGLMTATIGGAAIGVERQWSGHASGANARFGGIRTFTLLGGVAGVAGWLATGVQLPLAAVLLAAEAALIVLGYAAASRQDIDGTTEVAALVALAAGTLAGAGHVASASAVTAATVLLLLEKTRLHALVARLDDASLRASARFAAMACIVLPMLPSGPFGPLGVFRPRELWALVLFFSGLSFAGWIARRIVAPFVVGVVTLAALWHADSQSLSSPAGDDSPLQLRAALQMIALFQVVLVVILGVQEYWGPQALVATSAFIGLTDLDALTLSLARGLAPGEANVAIALVAGIIANTALKLVVAVAIGRGPFRYATGTALGIMGLVMLAMVIR